MKLLDELFGRAVADEQLAGDMAQEERDRMGRKEAYDALGAEFDRAAADGYLDKNEIDALLKDFRAKGLDTKALEEIAGELKNHDRVEVKADLRSSIADEINDAKAKDNDPFFNSKTQMVMGDYNQAVSLIANIQKTEHEKYQGAIKNMIC